MNPRRWPLNALRTFAAATIAFLMQPVQVFGWASEWGPDQKVSTGGWPPRLLELVNLSSRVAGYFINQDDYFAFRGDTERFQSFLDTCADLGDFASVTLHIHKGKGLFASLDKQRPGIPCNWQLNIVNQHWRSAEPTPKGPVYALELHVWSDNGIDFSAIRMPRGLKKIED